MNNNALDIVLEDFAAKGIEAAVTLRDGASLFGRIKRYDGYVILLEGNPEVMVYRHSILKFSEKTAEAVKPAPKPAEQPARPRRPSEPRRQSSAPRRQPPRSAPVSAREEPAKEPGSLSPMGEAMLKWLKSQQGK